MDSIKIKTSNSDDLRQRKTVRFEKPRTPNGEARLTNQLRFRCYSWTADWNEMSPEFMEHLKAAAQVLDLHFADAESERGKYFRNGYVLYLANRKANTEELEKMIHLANSKRQN